MKTRIYNTLFLVIILVITLNCANRGNPSGGDKDVLPPKIIKSEPENFSLNFTGEEIRIYFDEYVKIKNLSKQLIISPPMEIEPEITPLSTANKYIKIKLKSKLEKNTTYSFNFGNSIVDNNEENPFPFFKYVFSTGTYIDSLKVHGKISEALDRKIESFVIVNLYERDSTYTDSVVYLKKPRYMTNTQDSTTNFTLENVKAGTYKLVAIKDDNEDQKFQQKTDKIGFVEDFITVGQDSAFYDIKLFKETIDDKALKPRLVSGEKIAFGFEGDYTNFKIENLSETPKDFKSVTIKQFETDSLNYFYKPKLEQDSLIFNVSNSKQIDTFTVRLKDNRRDSLKIISLNKGKIGLDESFRLNANIPLTSIKKRFIKLIDKDSIKVDYKVKLNKLENTYDFTFNKTEDNKYTLDLLPKALTDFFGNTNDTLQFKVSTRKLSSYGNKKVDLKNATFPLFVQLVDKDNVVKYSHYIKNKKQPIEFLNTDPGIYYLRVLFDTNKNGIYDTGNYLKQEQPERVSYAKKEIEVRANWDEIIEFTLD
ncbi:Ig-like domain-containing protein [Aurantibacter sp.]|uniref:Ig-like domain-containing protein n=1 Tax=Aurantibacter sp. TaxID=2807103 RepID=UPI0035C7E605